MEPKNFVKFNLVNDDFFRSQADVYILKYPQGLNGLEKIVVKKIHAKGVDVTSYLPLPNEHFLIDNNGSLLAKKTLFIGVPNLWDFGYDYIYRFAKNSLEILKSEMIEVEEINVTIHGVNYGLNLREAFQSEINGFIDAIKQDMYPPSLKRITISEKKYSYYTECKRILDEILPENYFYPHSCRQSNFPNEEAKNNLIFISCKSEDFELANIFYDFLISRGKKVFFSERTIPEIGNANYRRMIDDALDDAFHMVVIGSKRENIRSPWIEHEWGFFINEINSGRKKGNIISIITDPISIRDLPPSLRNYEVIQYDETQFEKALCFLQ